MTKQLATMKPPRHPLTQTKTNMDREHTKTIINPPAPNIKQKNDASLHGHKTSMSTHNTNINKMENPHDTKN